MVKRLSHFYIPPVAQENIRERTRERTRERGPKNKKTEEPTRSMNFTLGRRQNALSSEKKAEYSLNLSGGPPMLYGWSSDGRHTLTWSLVLHTKGQSEHDVRIWTLDPLNCSNSLQRFVGSMFA